MFAVTSEISWLAVALATVALAVLGGLYFGVAVPKLYLQVLGRQAPVRQSAVTAVGPLVCGLATVLTSAVLMAALGIEGLGDAVVFGAIVGVGYLAAMTFQIAINPNFPHPLKYGLLNSPYFVGGSVLAAALLVTV